MIYKVKIKILNYIFNVMNHSKIDLYWYCKKIKYIDY